MKQAAIPFLLGPFSWIFGGGEQPTPVVPIDKPTPIEKPILDDGSSHHDSSLLTVVPKQSDAILTNPGIGFTELQRIVSNDSTNPFYESRPVPSYPDTSTVYYRWYWDQLTTRDNSQLDENMLERKIDRVLRAADAANKKVVIRFMALRGKHERIYDTDVDKSSSGIPCWLVQEVYGHGLNGGSCQLSNTEAVNLFKNPLFVKRAQQFLAALGKRYDNNKTLLRIDMGMVGTWGEWNLSSYTSNSSRVDLDQNGYTLKDVTPYIDAMSHAFPHTQKTMLATYNGDFLSYATQRGFGWRVDCLGDWGPGWNHMENGYPDMIANMTDVFKNKHPDILFDQRWRTAAVDFEICQNSLQDWYNWYNPQNLTNAQVQKTFDFALEQHGSLFNAKSGSIPNAYQPLVKQFLNKLGYRYQLNQVESDPVVHQNGYLHIKSQWENKGVAPSYTNYPVTWRLRKANGEIVAYYTANVDIRRWLPASKLDGVAPIYQVNDKFLIDSNLAKGQYFVDVGLVEQNTHKAKITLAIDTRLTDDNGQAPSSDEKMDEDEGSQSFWPWFNLRSSRNSTNDEKDRNDAEQLAIAKHSKKYVTAQNNIARWHEITTVNVI